jgi:Flp pilus assembly protein TadG
MKGKGLKLRLCRLIARSEAGSAMVEVALMFPIFTALLLGAVELGDLARRADEVTAAARTAAQYATMRGGAFTDCNVNTPFPPSSPPTNCTSDRGVYAAAVTSAPFASKCNSFTVQEATSCTCSDATGTCAAASTYVCSAGQPIITVSIYTQARCSPAATVPNLFPTATAFTLNGFSQEEVLQ